eukprot:TRINITY_DN9159_c0_g2_i1.p1 TRINITY_DN9159_c0_g2~~TRINITY_DN9159_c0_g2_i1.p1  ORF type:complete len:1196 (+),score=336.00 TRINITY_DN9159_c0_g2_i1:205-3792(+)
METEEIKIKVGQGTIEEDQWSEESQSSDEEESSREEISQSNVDHTNGTVFVGGQEGFRRIFSNLHPEGKSVNTLARFPKNAIHTTKYKWYNFIFKNIYEQFHRLANFFFLVTALLTLVPNLTNITPVSSISPLLFVLGVTAIKEIYEDLKRARSDSEINGRKALVFKEGEFKQVHWRDIRVGDFVKVPKDEEFPADLALMSSSLSSGVSYIQTANLDGETNLKVRQCLEGTTRFKNPDKISKWRGVLECEQPNKDLYNFDGRIYIKRYEDSTPLSLSNNQILLRGCILKNTEWVIGVAVFTGNDTKVRQNARDPPYKRSSLEKSMNSGLLYLFAFMFLLCLVCAICGVSLASLNDWYLLLPERSAANVTADFFFLLGSYVILYSYMIPISLYVSIEVVKVAQTILIDQDLHMYHEESDTPAKAKTSNLNEELGQIDFVFSDKTGTLTSNIMELMQVSVNGTVYDTTVQSPEETEFATKEKLLQDIQKSETLREFWTLLAVCHTVLPEKDSSVPGGIAYQASSPDEFALVKRAADLDFIFKNRTFNTVQVEHDGKILKYRILNMVDFTSNRKRMSVIVKTPTGKVRLYIKGADNMIFPRLIKTPETEEAAKHLELFASEGLRTLCCAYVDLDATEYEAWNAEYEEANSSVVDRKQRLEEVAEKIERNLTLLGLTAIEDKLQDEVPQTIQALRKANLKIWVLTGDKQETAINIGLSCRLLTDTNLVQFNLANKQINPNTLKDEIMHALGKIESTKKDTLVHEVTDNSLVIDGELLSHILDNPQVEEKFMELALKCKSVVCCRVSPSQKSAVVRCVKEHVAGARTLAIGDGANDVSMIQEAHVGVGIFGKEGMQAAMNSDYAIAQFRFLKSLLLVHGRWSYKRIAKLILYSFYKNMVLSMCLFLFNIYSLFSAQNFFDSWSMTLFNLVFTSVPVMVVAVIDQDVKQRNALKYPQLYRSGQLNEDFTMRELLFWNIIALFEALVIFFGTLLYFGDGVISAREGTFDFASLSHVAFTVVIITVNIKMAISTNYWTWLNTGAILFSVISWFLYSIIYSSDCSFSEDDCYVAQHVWSGPTYWFLIIILTAVCILPEIATIYVRRTYFYRPNHIVQEIQMKIRKEHSKERKMKKRFGPQNILKVTTSSNVDGEEQRPNYGAHTGYAFAESEDAASSLQAALKKKYLRKLTSPRKPKAKSPPPQ